MLNREVRYSDWLLAKMSKRISPTSMFSCDQLKALYNFKNNQAKSHCKKLGTVEFSFMKSIPLFVSLFSLISLMTANSGFSQPSKFVGSDECGRYDSRDKRPLPPARRMLSAFFDVEGSGYVLNVNYEGEGRVASYRFDSDLKFKYEDRNQLKISSEGKFKFSIDHRAEWCMYSGTAKMSPQASSRLFGQRSGSNDFPTSSSMQVANGINTVVESTSCQNALTEAVRRIESANASVNRITRYDYNRTFHSDNYPKDRPFRYTFVISGAGLVDVISSTMFLTEITSQIISSCPSVSLSRFGQYRSDYGRDFGLMENGKVKPFECANPDRARTGKIPWGEEFCP